MHRPSLLPSFFLAGFECASHRRADGVRLDLTAATAHDQHALRDYRRMRTHGIAVARDGLRWHLIEQRPGRYEFASFLPMLDASIASDLHVIWDLSHYGWPDGLDIWRPEFVERFADYAGAVARTVRDRSAAVPWYCPINEPSFWSWAGGDQGLFGPNTRGRGLELKHQLTRATIAAIHAVRDADPRARFLHPDPLIHVHAASSQHQEEADRYLQAQFDGWLLLSGDLWPGLGGRPEYVDIVGVNYYPHNQWTWNAGRLLPEDPSYRPLRELLAHAHARLARPMIIAETSAEGTSRAGWLRYVCDEVLHALANDVPIEGICLYPVLDYPGWDDDRVCETGLYGFAREDGHRQFDRSLADELAFQQARFDALNVSTPSASGDGLVARPAA